MEQHVLKSQRSAHKCPLQVFLWTFVADLAYLIGLSGALEVSTVLLLPSLYRLYRQIRGDRTSLLHTNEPPVTTMFPRCILETPISKLAHTIVNLNERGTPCHFRFLDCDAFINSGLLRIIECAESDSIEEVSFAAVSYPWRDLQMPPGTAPPEGSFSVKGAEHADEISIDVLRTACTAARHFGISLMWVDRLCILQTQKIDKNWQIHHMYKLYASCNLCLILPGGLVRLARLSDPTSWIDRAWTLQEAVAPSSEEKLHIVFSFTQSTYIEFLRQECAERFNDKFMDFLHASKHNPLEVILEPGHSAACKYKTLSMLLWGCVGALKYHQPTISKPYDAFPVRIIYQPAMRHLQRAVDFGGLSVLKASFSRTSSRPVDMIFSIMGLMGVRLEVSKYTAEDRLKATIHLIQALMSRGDRAHWLFLAPELPACPGLSTLPVMPETSESGRAYLRAPGGLVPAFEVMDQHQQWRSDGAPVGVMSDAGDFTFSAQAVLVIREDPSCGDDFSNDLTTTNEERWGIVIGRHRELNKDPETGRLRSTPASEPVPVGWDEFTLMFVESHADSNLYHRIGMEKEVDERKTRGWNWTSREFHVGGPGRGERQRFHITPEGPARMPASILAEQTALDLTRYADLSGKSDRIVIHH